VAFERLESKVTKLSETLCIIRVRFPVRLYPTETATSASTDALQNSRVDTTWNILLQNPVNLSLSHNERGTNSFHQLSVILINAKCDFRLPYHDEVWSRSIEVEGDSSAFSSADSLLSASLQYGSFWYGCGIRERFPQSSSLNVAELESSSLSQPISTYPLYAAILLVRGNSTYDVIFSHMRTKKA